MAALIQRCASGTALARRCATGSSLLRRCVDNAMCTGCAGNAPQNYVATVSGLLPCSACFFLTTNASYKRVVTWPGLDGAYSLAFEGTYPPPAPAWFCAWRADVITPPMVVRTYSEDTCENVVAEQSYTQLRVRLTIRKTSSAVYMATLEMRYTEQYNATVFSGCLSSDAPVPCAGPLLFANGFWAGVNCEAMSDCATGWSDSLHATGGTVTVD